MYRPSDYLKASNHKNHGTTLFLQHLYANPGTFRKIWLYCGCWYFSNLFLRSDCRRGFHLDVTGDLDMPECTTDGLWAWFRLQAQQIFILANWSIIVSFIRHYSRGTSRKKKDFPCLELMWYDYFWADGLQIWHDSKWEKIRVIAWVPARRAPLIIWKESRINAVWKRSHVECSILLMNQEISGESGKYRCLMDCITVHKWLSRISWWKCNSNGTHRASFTDTSYVSNSMRNESRAGKQHGGMNAFALA